MIFHNTKFNFFYFLSYRVGSTLLKKIAEVHDEIKFLTFEDGIKKINENLERPIYVVYREPLTRFKSGLEIVFRRDFIQGDQYHDQGVDNLLNSGYDEIFLQKLISYDNLFSLNIPFVSGYSRGRTKRCFHLYDNHTDHNLWKALILIAYEYNVRLIPLNEYTKHLTYFYPRFSLHDEEISKNMRKSSFDSNKELSLKLWNIYKKVFVDNLFCKPDVKLKKLITFDEWMSEEKMIFNALEKYTIHSDVNIMHHVIKNLFENRIYFSDIHGPSSIEIASLLHHIHTIKNPIKPFNMYVQKFSEYQYHGANFNLGTYLPKTSVI